MKSAPCYERMTNGFSDGEQLGAMKMDEEKKKVWLLDAGKDLQHSVRCALDAEFEICHSSSSGSAQSSFPEHPSVILMEETGRDESRLRVREIFDMAPRTKLIILTRRSPMERGLEWLEEGAFDVIGVPFEPSELRTIIRRGVFHCELEENRAVEIEREEEGGFAGMVGTTVEMKRVFSGLRRVARTSAPVLILGESGTGKEMAARAIHRSGARRESAFVPINCGAIPESLIESELFGHEKGAFTGAHLQRAGRIEMADGGTLFLDEIGELPVHLQVKLLRYLQERQIQRLGGRKEIPVDAHIIAATSVDLERAIRENAFREDLYYRLAVVTLRLPPLRERKRDLARLGKLFLQKYQSEGRRLPRLTQEARFAIEQYHWPGNIRELENRIRRAAIMCERGRITPADLELEEVGRETPGRGLKSAREAAERNVILGALEMYGWNISAAAMSLGISRPTLYELLRRLEIKRWACD